jgi:rubredoxin
MPDDVLQPLRDVAAGVAHAKEALVAALMTTGRRSAPMLRRLCPQCGADDATLITMVFSLRPDRAISLRWQCRQCQHMWETEDDWL